MREFAPERSIYLTLSAQLFEPEPKIRKVRNSLQQLEVDSQAGVVNGDATIC